MMIRTVFYLSDSTGITAKTLGQSVLSQFNDTHFNHQVISHIDDLDKAKAAVKRIEQSISMDEYRPIIFDTLVNTSLAFLFKSLNCLRFDIMDMYIAPLEQELKQNSSHEMGKAHGQANSLEYKSRIDAVHFAMANDDGGRIQSYDKADIILTGVSRCGKTPTSLYLALQYGIYAANYPITEDDMGECEIPNALRPFRQKLFGLTIDAERLSRIRTERKSDSRYASIKQCRNEVDDVEAMFRRFAIEHVDVTDSSVEEIAARIFNLTHLNQYKLDQR